MSIEHMTTVWKSAPVDGVTLLVLLALADSANDDGWCWPRVKTLAERARASERTVQRSLEELSKLGWVSVQRRTGKSSFYRVHLDPRQNVTPDKTDPVDVEPAPDCHPTPDTDVTDPRHSCVTPTTLNHQGTTREPSPPADAGAQVIVGEWLDRCAERPPGRIIGQIAKHVKEMLDEGIKPDSIRRGLANWMTKDRHPSVLPSMVNSAMNVPSTNGVPTSDAKIANLQRMKSRPALPGGAA